MNSLIAQLGGVIKPHDGQCHMDDLKPDSTGNVVYREWNIMVSALHSALALSSTSKYFCLL